MHETKHRIFYGKPILSRGLLPVSPIIKNKILTRIQFRILNYFGSLDEANRYSQYFARLARTLIGAYIYSIKIELNNLCQLKCDMCYVKPGNDELEKHHIRSLFTQIKDCGIRVEILGGEPLLRKDIVPVISDAKQIAKSPFVSIYTNGMLASQKMVSNLKNAGLDAALITLISHKEEIHDQFTGIPGSWKKSINGIINFLRLEIETYTFTAVHNKNVDSIQDIHDFVKNELKAKPLFYQYIPVKMGDPLCLSKEKWYEVKTRILSQNKAHFNFVRNYYMLTGNACSGGNYVLTVKVDGSIQPCPFMDNLSMGNIKKQSIWKIYKKRFKNQAFKDFKSLPESCGSCTYSSVCGGGCRAGQEKLSGTYADRDHRCKGPYDEKLLKIKIMENTPCFF